MRACPKCGHDDVKDAATMCRWCHAEIPHAGATAADPASGTKRCPFCAEEIQAAAIVCKHCQRDLVMPKASPVAIVAAARKGSGVRRVFTLALYAFFAIAGLTALIAVFGGGSSPSAPMKTIRSR